MAAEKVKGSKLMVIVTAKPNQDTRLATKLTILSQSKTLIQSGQHNYSPMESQMANTAPNGHGFFKPTCHILPPCCLSAVILAVRD